jgi:hypothetical protein
VEADEVLEAGMGEDASEDLRGQVGAGDDGDRGQRLTAAPGGQRQAAGRKQAEACFGAG